MAATIGFAPPATSAGLSVLVTTDSADELGASLDTSSAPGGIKPLIKVENPRDAYNSLILRSRDFTSAKARIVPEALKKHFHMSMDFDKSFLK